MHTFILNACYRYSPNELEVNIFDFKNGAEFSLYKNKLPHVRYLALGVSIDAAMELVDFIEKEMEKRYEFFTKSNQSNNILQYNEYARANGLPLVPRSIIIIDEYEDILTNEQIIKKLETIALKGRAAGISLVLASQRLPTANFSLISSQIANRIAFKNLSNEIDNMIEGCGKRLHEIEELNGSCFYKQGFDQTKEADVVRIAFSGDKTEERDHYLEIIRKKYSDYTVSQLIFSGVTEESSLLTSDDFKTNMDALVAAQETELPIEFNSFNPKRNINNGYMLHHLGKHFYTGTDCFYELSPKNPLLCIVGERENTDSIVLTLVHDILYLFKHNHIEEPQLYYIDLNPNRFDTPMKQLKKRKDEASINTPEKGVLRHILFTAKESGFEEVIERLWDLISETEDNGYTRRDSVYTPIVVFINCAETLQSFSDEEAYEHYCKLVEIGKDVFVTDFVFGKLAIQRFDFCLGNASREMGFYVLRFLVGRIVHITPNIQVAVIGLLVHDLVERNNSRIPGNLAFGIVDVDDLFDILRPQIVLILSFTVLGIRIDD